MASPPTPPPPSRYKNANLENYDKAVERNIKNLELEARKRAKAAYVDPAKAVEAKERGNELFRAGEFVKAIDEYEEAIKRDPTNPAYPNNLAATLSKIGDFAGAKRACEKALDLDDKYVKAWAVGAVGREAEAPLLAGTSRRGRRRATSSSS